MTEVTAKVELKPCPFECEGPQKAVFPHFDGERWFVLCNYCACQGPDGVNAEDAVDGWNQRDLRPNDALRAALGIAGEALDACGRLDRHDYFMLDVDDLRARLTALNERNPTTCPHGSTGPCSVCGDEG